MGGKGGSSSLKSRLHACCEPRRRHRYWDLTRGKPWPFKHRILSPTGPWTTQGKQVAALPGDEAGEADEVSHHYESAPAAPTPFKPSCCLGTMRRKQVEGNSTCAVAHHKVASPGRAQLRTRCAAGVGRGAASAGRLRQESGARASLLLSLHTPSRSYGSGNRNAGGLKSVTDAAECPLQQTHSGCLAGPNQPCDAGLPLGPA